MLFAKPSTRASRNVEGISTKKNKEKKTGADKEQKNKSMNTKMKHKSSIVWSKIKKDVSNG